MRATLPEAAQRGKKLGGGFGAKNTEPVTEQAATGPIKGI
jgi:hypothetical protein